MCFQRLKKKYHRYTIQSYEYVCFYMGPQVVVGNLRNGFIPLVIAGVIIWHQPKQRTITREFPQNYHTFAFDSPQNG